VGATIIRKYLLFAGGLGKQHRKERGLVVYLKLRRATESLTL